MSNLVEAFLHPQDLLVWHLRYGDLLGADGVCSGLPTSSSTVHPSACPGSKPGSEHPGFPEGVF
jgi:hypothetical protein